MWLSFSLSNATFLFNISKKIIFILFRDSLFFFSNTDPVLQDSWYILIGIADNVKIKKTEFQLCIYFLDIHKFETMFEVQKMQNNYEKKQHIGLFLLVILYFIPST